ncbi:hypothetical protein J437_LFUL014218 [Ladona fulva]|uniref:Uncharacterized protein n=1 Tax=Ladona fulva TaxID=123851 RepID=A0A8K0KLY4_LADFU|nr:hypothetical protein J437_LFUL014218 [Ladona fulva]
MVDTRCIALDCSRSGARPIRQLSVCTQRLGLPYKRAITSIFGLAQTAVDVTHRKLTVIFEPTPKGGPIEVEALVIEDIARCPKMEVLNKQWPHIRNLTLADLLYYRPESIDILLGAEWLGTVMIGNTVTGPKGTLSAIETLWRYCLVGKVHQSADRIDSLCLAMESQLDCLI